LKTSLKEAKKPLSKQANSFGEGTTDILIKLPACQPFPDHALVALTVDRGSCTSHTGSLRSGACRCLLRPRQQTTLSTCPP
jgi:hypothetical protein